MGLKVSHYARVLSIPLYLTSLRSQLSIKLYTNKEKVKTKMLSKESSADLFMNNKDTFYTISSIKTPTIMLKRVLRKLILDKHLKTPLESFQAGKVLLKRDFKLS